MKEEFLHYLWKHKKIPFQNLKTENEDPIEILNWGFHNHNSGPDFKECVIKIGDTTWAGQVEMHLKASDWYVHKHQYDKAYDNVILHVVWEYDKDVFIKKQPLPVLVLKGKVPHYLLRNYQSILSEKKTIVCHNELPNYPEDLWKMMLQKKAVERLEDKVSEINRLMKDVINDRKEVTQIIMARGFGMKLNKDTMMQLGIHFPFRLVEKYRNDPNKIRAISYGLAGWLKTSNENLQWEFWQTEYRHLQKLNQLSFQMDQKNWLLGRLRPSNFPTIRLAQWTELLIEIDNMYDAVINWETNKWRKVLGEIQIPGFWNTHYLPSKKGSSKIKRIGKSMVDHLLINTILPLKFYFNKLDQKEITDVLELLGQIDAEKNFITKKYKALDKPAENALESQAQIQLHKYYCQPKKCLQCEVAQSILKKA